MNIDQDMKFVDLSLISDLLNTSITDITAVHVSTKVTIGYLTLSAICVASNNSKRVYFTICDYTVDGIDYFYIEPSVSYEVKEYPNGPISLWKSIVNNLPQKSMKISSIDAYIGFRLDGIPRKTRCINGVLIRFACDDPIYIVPSEFPMSVDIIYDKNMIEQYIANNTDERVTLCTE